MNFKLWLEQTKTLPIAELVMEKDELSAAIDNITRGYPAMTEGPVEVAYMTQMQPERYQLVNGYHRMVEAMLRGEMQVQVQIQDVDTSGWMIPQPNNIFSFQPDQDYKGLEDFIEPYMLRRL